ncbi:MAG: HAAS signaling domain-containing protein [Acidimicrobiales bacterium]
MTTAMHDTLTPEADAYVKEVASYLGAVPADERDEILEDLTEHLREMSAEPDSSIAERLGPARSYANELLASAGYASDVGTPKLLWRTASWAGRTAGRVRHTLLGQEAARLGPVVRTAWWIGRAYFAVSLLASIENGHGSYPGFPFPHLAGSALIGFLAVVVAVPLSVRLGQRPRAGKRRRVLAIGVNIVLVLFAIVLLGRVSRAESASASNQYGPVSQSGPFSQNGCLTDGAGQDITNLYVYGPDGSLLSPVLIYDQNGEPINNLCPYTDSNGRPLSTTYSEDVNGAPVYNAFPRAQSVLSGLGQAQPVTPPAVVIPKLAPTTTATTTP